MKYVSIVTALIALGCAATPPPAVPPAASVPTEEEPAPEPEEDAAPASGQGPASNSTSAEKCGVSAPDQCEQACDAGDERACFTAATGYGNGPEEVRSPEKEESALTRACDLGHAPSCGNLGLMHEKGEVRERDLDKAMSYYSKACDSGVAIACRNVGKLYGGHEGYPKDEEKSEAAYKKAYATASSDCEKGAAEGCAAQGFMLRDGVGVEANAEESAKMLSRACDMGYQWACPK